LRPTPNTAEGGQHLVWPHRRRGRSQRRSAPSPGSARHERRGEEVIRGGRATEPGSSWPETAPDGPRPIHIL
jgi:hypothetical protein